MGVPNQTHVDDSILYAVTIAAAMLLAYTVETRGFGSRRTLVARFLCRTLAVYVGVTLCLFQAHGPWFHGIRILLGVCAVVAGATALLNPWRGGRLRLTPAERAWLVMMSALLGSCGVMGHPGAVTLAPWVVGYLAGPSVFVSAPVAVGYSLSLTLLAPLWYPEPSLTPDWMVHSLLALPGIVRLVAAVGLAVCWGIGGRQYVADGHRRGREAGMSFLRQLATGEGGNDNGLAPVPSADSPPPTHLRM